MFDMSVGCGNWAMRPTPPADVASTEEALRAEGISGACAYALEAWFWPDPQEANELRLPEIAQSEYFTPSAVLNPTLPGWLRGYESCRERWQIPLVRLMPAYHAYDLADQAVDEIAERAAQDDVVLGVHLRAEDERMQNPIALVPGTPLTDVVMLARRHPGLRVIVFGFARLNELADVVPQAVLGRLRDPDAPEAAADLPDNLWIDLSFHEHESSLVVATRLFRTERMLFSTHWPLFYPRCNVLKIRNSEAPDDVKTAVTVDNARALLGVRP